eukprot:1159955-Pelagomonas_calceolata.AAC.13
MEWQPPNSANSCLFVCVCFHGHVPLRVLVSRLEWQSPGSARTSKHHKGPHASPPPAVDATRWRVAAKLVQVSVGSALAVVLQG